MKQLFIVFLLLTSITVNAQDIAVVMKEAENFEKQLKEPEALDKYKQAVALDAANMKALVKCVELECRIGGRQKDAEGKKSYYNDAADYANKAYLADSNNADAYYAKALVAGKLTEVEEEKKKLVELVKQIHDNAAKAVALNANHARANYVLGKWHLEMLNLNWFKKAAIKTLYGGLPKADVDSAITYMEKCRNLEPYFAINYLDLAKAYAYKNRPNQEIEVLTKLVKLPTRTADDAAIKAEGQKMLEEAN